MNSNSPSPIPARKLRFEQIEELTYDELMNHLEYENEAVASHKMADLSDYHGKLIDQIDRGSFEIAVRKQYALWKAFAAQRDLEKFSYDRIV